MSIIWGGALSQSVVIFKYGNLPSIKLVTICILLLRNYLLWSFWTKSKEQIILIGSVFYKDFVSLWCQVNSNLKPSGNKRSRTHIPVVSHVRAWVKDEATVKNLQNVLIMCQTRNLIWLSRNKTWILKSQKCSPVGLRNLGKLEVDRIVWQIFQVKLLWKYSRSNNCCEEKVCNM